MIRAPRCLAVVAAVGLAWTIAAVPVRAEPTEGRRRKIDQADRFMMRHNLYPACAKLGRGLANTFTGWLEIPLNMQRYYVPNDTGAGMFTDRKSTRLNSSHRL